MNLGQGSLGITPGESPSGSPFAAASAHNGTSIDADGKVVLGDDGDGSANLESSRQIQMQGNEVSFISSEAVKTINATGTDFHQNDGASFPLRSFQLGEQEESGWYHDTVQIRSILYIQNPPR